MRISIRTLFLNPLFFKPSYFMKIIFLDSILKYIDDKLKCYIVVFQVSFGSSRGEAGSSVSQSLQHSCALSAFVGEVFGMHSALRRKLQGGISSSRTHKLCCQTPPLSDILTIKLALLSLWRWEASSRLYGFWLPASTSPPLTSASLQHALPYTHLS